jgi:hypothetical protein
MTAEGSLAQALVEAQKRMPAVPKDTENPHFRSKFTSLDSLIAATRPILNDAGLAITQFPALSETGHPVLRTTLTHGPTGQELSFETPLYVTTQTEQGHGRAITYARRYAWAALLGIASEEDTDGNVPQPAKPEEKPVEAVRMASAPQKAKMGILVKELAASGLQLPSGFPGAETWTDVLRMHLSEEYGVTTRTDLTSKQASEVIDFLELQKIPF